MNNFTEDIDNLNNEIICSKPAYDRLKNAGIIELIDSKKQTLIDLFIMNDFSNEIEETINEAYDYIYNKNEKINEKTLFYKDIIEFDIETKDCFYYSDKIKQESLKHPALVSYLILKNEIFSYKSFGFQTIKSLEESVVSYVIGERTYNSYENELVWRNNKYRHAISLNIHGDLYAEMIDISENEKKTKGLFEELIEFEAIKSIQERQGIYAYQDWSEFLVTLLKYSKIIGLENIYEIVSWKEVLNEVGSITTNTAEAMFGGTYDKSEILFMNDILIKGKKVENFPMLIQNSEKFFIPYLQDENLHFLKSDENGDIKINEDLKIFNDKKFKSVLCYTPLDMPNALKATYKFFARDKTLLPKIMDYFLKT